MSKVVSIDWPATAANGRVCIQLRYMPCNLPHLRRVCLVLGLLRTIRLI